MVCFEQRPYLAEFDAAQREIEKDDADGKADDGEEGLFLHSGQGIIEYSLRFFQCSGNAASLRRIFGVALRSATLRRTEKVRLRASNLALTQICILILAAIKKTVWRTFVAEGLARIFAVKLRCAILQVQATRKKLVPHAPMGGPSVRGGGGRIGVSLGP